MPPKYPSFRRGKDGTLVLYDSDAARQFKERAWFPPQPASQVENIAKESVRERDGDVNDRRDLLGEFTLQSGKYRGQTLSWLLGICPGYVGWFVGSVLEDRVKGDKSSVTQMANKDALLEYCSMFEESRAIVGQKLSDRRQEIQEQWKRLCGKKNVVPWQLFHLLLSSRELSSEVLSRKARRIATPKKVAPNFTQASRSPATADDLQLLEAVQEFEVQSDYLR
ncbi:uncharacterized protein LOC130054585 [Ostrea edulis]|uniref:uncharacterized protein LOC130054585 n=1 Tax=Ostrea edulis TaxID=37623 RepID=UPI0024AF38FC|nr:uncharacterized protein LOC130054585 [Ostrea edulis]